MFRTNDILLQSRPFNKNSISFRFSDLIYDVYAQFKEEHVDRLIYSVDKHGTYDEVKNSLVNGIISSRCNLLKKRMSEKLSINEQFYVLAHLDLGFLIPKVEDPSPVFVSLVQSIVHDIIITG